MHGTLNERTAAPMRPGRAGRPAKGSEAANMRMLVLDLLVEEAGKPATAYALLSKLEGRLGRRLSPPTIYRALRSLLASGRIARIESQAAFVLVRAGEAGDPRIFLLCCDCHRATEVGGVSLGEDLARLTAQAHFVASRSVIEIEGVCRDCGEARATM